MNQKEPVVVVSNGKTLIFCLYEDSERGDVLNQNQMPVGMLLCGQSGSTCLSINGFNDVEYGGSPSELIEAIVKDPAKYLIPLTECDDTDGSPGRYKLLVETFPLEPGRVSETSVLNFDTLEESERALVTLKPSSTGYLEDVAVYKRTVKRLYDTDVYFGKPFVFDDHQLTFAPINDTNVGINDEDGIRVGQLVVSDNGNTVNVYFGGGLLLGVTGAHICTYGGRVNDLMKKIIAAPEVYLERNLQVTPK